jgi:ABC-type phosphate/phosphonate transport system substrate-binding protein
LGVRDGVAEQVSPLKLQYRYEDFADYIAQAVGKPTLVDASQEATSVFEKMKAGRYAVMFVRPSGLAGRAIREGGFTLVAEAKDELHAAVIVRKDSPLKRPQDLIGKRVAMPDQTAFITKVGFAALRDMQIDPARLNVQYTRYQDSAAYMVEHGLADAAIVSPIVAKPWEAKGGRVLVRSQRLPSWAVVASPKLSPAEVEKLRKALLSLDSSDSGRKILQQIGVSGFATGKPDDYLALLKWIGV